MLNTMRIHHPAMGCRHDWKPNYTYKDWICTKCGRHRGNNHRRRRSGSGKKAAALTVVAGAFILVLFMSGSVNVDHLVGVTTDGLEDVADGVVSLNPDMAADITQQIGEAARTTQEWADGAAEDAARMAEEREAEAARVAAEREAADAARRLEAAKEAISDINDIRTSHGVPEMPFDERAYQLALARANDINEYNYPIAHTNPYTGTCPDNMKSQYGFGAREYVAENLAGPLGSPSLSNYMSYTEATEMWMGSPGHRTNLLWPTHYGGAVACDSGVCVFLGTNRDMYGAGCY